MDVLPLLRRHVLHKGCVHDGVWGVTKLSNALLINDLIVDADPAPLPRLEVVVEAEGVKRSSHLTNEHLIQRLVHDGHAIKEDFGASRKAEAVQPQVGHVGHLGTRTASVGQDLVPVGLRTTNGLLRGLRHHAPFPQGAIKVEKHGGLHARAFLKKGSWSAAYRFLIAERLRRKRCKT